MFCKHVIFIRCLPLVVYRIAVTYMAVGFITLGSTTLGSIILSSTADAAQVDRSTVPTRPSFREENEPQPSASSVLPELELQEPTIDSQALGAPEFFVRQIELVGNSVLTAEMFTELTAKYSNRMLSFAELQQLRDEATLLYINQGYLTSGAVIRSLVDDVLTVDLIEGVLAEIQIAEPTRYQKRYLKNYIRGFGPTDPVNVFSIEKRLQILQTEPHIERVEAQLLPGSVAGQSLLSLATYEVSPFRLQAETNNHLSPSLGSEQVLASVDYLNFRGVGDDIYVGIRAAQGLTELSASYQRPVNARGRRMSYYVFSADSEIVDTPFDQLDISAHSRTLGLRLDQPLRRGLKNNTTLYLTAEWRQSNTELLGVDFSFVDGPEDGNVRIAVLRTGVEQTRRTARNVLSGRAQLSVGLDAFGATSGSSVADDTPTPQADFVVFLGQAQWAQRLTFLSSRVVTRIDLQLANEPLFGLEQLPIGGRWSVRGYRENTLSRDSGVVGSVEWKVPLQNSANSLRPIELGAFLDWSHSWNSKRGEIGPGKLSSIGLGVNWRPSKSLDVEAWWGYAFDDIDYSETDSLFDDGVHVRLRWSHK